MSLRGVAAAVGFAEVPPTRDSGDASTLELLAHVGSDAVADAGLVLGDVDGLFVHNVGGIPGFVPAAVAEFVGVRPRVAELVDLGGATGAGMIWRAAAAIQAGMCTTCLCLTGAHRRPRREPHGKRGPKPPRPSPSSSAPRDRSPHAEFAAPYGDIGANTGYAMLATRYHHEYDVTVEQRAKVAVDQRRNANANPNAYFGGEELSIDDVVSSPMVSSPLRMFEIVMPVAGAAAVVVTDAARAVDSPNRPAWLLGAGESVTHSSFSQAPDLRNTGVGIAARAAFDMAGTTPGDVGLASLYDCYTIMVLLTLEEAGFCEPGEAGGFVDSHDLTWSGDFPLNTHGGQLSFGQPGFAGGMSHVTEAIRQIQGRGGERQVPDLDLAYVHGNGGVIAEQVGLVMGTDR